MILVNENNIEKYNEFLEKHDRCNFQQSVAWGKVKEAWINEIVLAEDKDGNIVGSVSVLIRKIPIFGNMMYVSRGPICDIHDKKVLSDLTDSLKELAKKYKAFILKMEPDIKSNDQEFEDIPLEDEKTKPLKSEGNDEEKQKPKMKPMSKFLRRRRNVKPKEVKRQCIEQQVKDEEPSTLNMKRPSLKTPFFQDFLLDKNDEHKNRLLQLKLKNDINYGISKGGLSENELDLFSEFKKKINNMKNYVVKR